MIADLKDVPVPGSAKQHGYISTQFTVWCGGCAEWDQTTAVNKRKATVAWRSAGWRYTRARGWLCSVCFEKRSTI